jgi:hypothetical protein
MISKLKLITHKNKNTLYNYLISKIIIYITIHIFKIVQNLLKINKKNYT